MRALGITDKGLKREQNQDSYVIVDDGSTLFVAVCDGIGGHQAGDIASTMTCNMLSSCFRNEYDGNPEEWFRMALKKVNRHVYEEAESKPELKGMGTTLVAAIFTENTTYILNVGDSRCYYFSKNDNLVQVSEDHSLVNDLIRIEGMEQEKAEAVGRHIITRAVGIWPVVEGDIYELNDEFKYLMLSSDGLHDYVDDEKMIDILMDNRSTGKKLEELVDAANGAGGYDNITVILVEE